MKLPIPIIETIKVRHSVRTYKKEALSIDEREKLSKYLNELKNPFNINISKYIIDKTLSPDGEKLGTYGIIKGANTFAGVSVRNIDMAPVAAGYEFENLILYATNMGLGTVWLAATFDRNAFSSAMEIPKDEIFLAISPIGYPAEKQRILEKIMRSTMKSSSRKQWNELFYNENFNLPLTEKIAGDYAVVLEMVRLAPSAKNIQPWRILKIGNIYHFYAMYKQDESKEVKIIKEVDMGIALSHFHQTALEKQLKGYFKKISQENIEIPSDYHYIISWEIE